MRYQVLLILSFTLLLLFPAPGLAGGEIEFQEGLRAYKARNYRTAAKKFEESLSKGNGSPDVYIYMAHSYSASGRTADAIQKYMEICKIFKGLPAATLGARCLQRLDPKGLWRARVSKRTTDKNKANKNLSFINRVFIIDPTVQGHPPVSSNTISAIKSEISRLPRHVYKILDDGGAKIFVGPNIIDKWPDALNATKPGMEKLTLSREMARTYGRDIYLWERDTLVGSTKLGPPHSPARVRTQIRYQFGHALDDCLGPMWEDPKFRKEYDADAEFFTEEERNGRLKYYTQPDYKGCGEVISEVILEYLGGRKSKVSKYFPRSKDFVLARLEQARKDVTGVANKPYAKKTIAKKVSTYGKLASAKPVIKPYHTPKHYIPEKKEEKKEIKQEDFIPKEERVPYRRLPGNKLFVAGTINGAPTQMLIDTGAYKVVLGSKEAKQLGIEIPKGPKKYIGTGATTSVKGWEKDLTVTLGKIKKTLPVQIMDGSQYPLLGQPFLKGMHYKIERSSNYIHFIKDSETAQKQSTVYAAEIPFRFVDGQMISVATVNGVNIEVNFDTGAPTCVFSPRDARRLRLKPTSKVYRAQTGGVGGNPVTTHYFEIDSISMGPIKRNNIVVSVMDGYASRYPLIGQTFFEHKKFVVDNEKKVIRFER